MPGNDEMDQDEGKTRVGRGHYNDTTCATHFPIDTRNENLPKKHIHRNYAETPGRDTAPGFLLRGRGAPVRGVFFRCKTRRETMTFYKGESGNPAGRPRGSRNRTTILMQSLLEAVARRSRARLSISPKAAIWRRFACAWTGWCRRESTSRSPLN